MESVALIVAAHPDDAEIAMGGTIAALVASGVRVIVADLTDGEPTPHGTPEIRAQESAEASRILGISDRRSRIERYLIPLRIERSSPRLSER
jgi:LmbE family N-acetylglucosaminyl deacetylase